MDIYFSHLTEVTETQTNTSNIYHNKILVDKELILPTNFELSFKAKSTMANNSRFGLCPVSSINGNNDNVEGFISCQQSTTYRNAVYRYNNRNNLVSSNTTITGTVYHDWKIIKQGNVFRWYFDDVQVGSDITLSWFDLSVEYTFLLTYWQSGEFNVKDLKIKEL